MDRQPNLIAPVIIVACALIVAGGIGTALSETGDSASTGAISTTPGAAVPTTGAVPGATGAGSAIVIDTATPGTGAGDAANGTTPGVNATVPAPRNSSPAVSCSVGAR